MSETLSVRPHARLLTMLGEQLIRNDRIALVEIIKNSYDADARTVVVNFQDFGEDLETTPESTIAILDDGSGMTEAVLKTDWLNPASPSKLHAKQITKRTALGRTMQGEKGIGRFALFKLGRIVEVVTRSAGDESEFVLNYDISMLDEDLIRAGVDPAANLYLDELPITFSRRTPRVFTGEKSRPLTGTRLRISSLRSRWDSTERELAYQDVLKLRPLTWAAAGVSSDSDDFRIRFLTDGKEDREGLNPAVELNRLIADRSVLKVENGHFDSALREYRFTLNGHDSTVPLSDVSGVLAYRAHFGIGDNPDIECGPFSFGFFVFDFSARAPEKYRLAKDEKDTLKQNRVYLYRDGIRVYPYGDAQDDWLHIDATRGTQGAGRMFSNDQLIGYVSITQEDNPMLRDKTNREGLVDAGRATSDFIVLIQVLLAYLRAKPYAQYVLDNHANARRQSLPTGIGKPLQQLANRDGLDSSTKAAVQEMADAYEKERTYFKSRAERTEDLAAVGLSVESASHDIIAALNESVRSARKLNGDIGRVTGVPVYVRSESSGLVNSLEFVSARMQDIQGLFVSTRQVRRPLNVAEYLGRVQSIYSRLLTEANVIVDTEGDNRQLTGDTTEAALLQLFVNLFDNALYWLKSIEGTRRILVTFDLASKTVRFSDSGPGVDPTDEPYIFEAFYSGKGEAGRGLGLYIAREVGSRNGFALELGRSEIGGATFEIVFESEREPSNANQ